MKTTSRLVTPNGTLTLPAFGEIEPHRLLAIDDLFTMIRDKYPVGSGHTLITTRRPVALFRDLTQAEKARPRLAGLDPHKSRSFSRQRKEKVLYCLEDVLYRQYILNEKALHRGKDSTKVLLL